MTNQRLRLASWILGAGTAAMVLSGVAGTAGAAAPASASFAARYAQNAQTEAHLLQQAEGGSGTIITAYSNTVQTINAQATVLYGSEQTLAAAKSGISSGNPGDRVNLVAEKRTLTHEIAAIKARIRKDRHDRKPAEEHALMLQLKTWTAQLRQVAFELAHPQVANGMWKRHPYAGGLLALQASILDLQRAAIHYTKLWIAAAKTPTPAAGSPATITGLAYAAGAITIPAAGAAAVTDAVSAAPIVKDAQGNILTDSGTYAIASPAGAIGVSIDASSGQVSVSSGATAGSYTVTYTQGSVWESVSLTVSQ